MLVCASLIFLIAVAVVIAEIFFPWFLLSGSDFIGAQKKQFVEDMKKYQELQDAIDSGEEVVVRKMTPEEMKQYAKELEIWR